jgi:ABC-2 type transport system ATP-binding protein
VLELVDLGDAADRRVGGYSLGMRQRLGFAAALLGDPPVLVLDEPANGLDPQGMHEMRDLLRARAASGHTVLVSSHLLAEVELLADDLVVIHRGRLVTSGSLESCRRTPPWSGRRRPLSCSGSSRRRRDRPARWRRHHRRAGPSIDDIGDRAFARRDRAARAVPHAGSLEERFLRWTSAAAEDAPGTTETGMTT